MRPTTVLFLTLILLFPGATAADSDSDGDFEAHVETELGEPGSLREQTIALDEVTRGSLLFRTSRSGTFLPAPGLETDVSIRVTGMIARAQVRQRFSNPTDRWLEGVYVFPLPEDAAVDGLKMVIGERVIEGEIHEKEEAKKVYAQAKKEGKKASLVEQERPNVFTTSVANIGPGEEIDVVLNYQQDLRYDSGTFSLRFPMTVAPRYIPGQRLAAPELPAAARAVGTVASTGFSAAGTGGHGWALATDQVPDAPRINPPVAVPSTESLKRRPRHPVFFHLELDVGLPLARLESPTHELHVEQGEGSMRIVELADPQAPANRDFVLEWEPETHSAPEAAFFTQELGDELYTLLMVLPPHGDAAGAARLPRETVIVIDTSGSMQGASIRQARQALLLALDHLRPEDHFNVIEFSSRSRKLFTQSMPASVEYLEQAKRWVDRLGANGGTEMLSALAAALEGQERDLGLRQVIFVTDGSVGNEAELFGFIRANLGGSRLFTVGIGSAPNSYFMRQAAEEGRGTFTYVGSVHEVGKRMGELFDKLESPVLHDVEIVWDDPQVETWPERVGDLYLGEPIQVASRLPIDPRGHGGGVKISGWRGAEYWERDFQLAGGAPEAGIDKLWARKKIGALTASLAGGADRQAVRSAVVELALSHHLVSKYTSLVAVDKTPTAPEGVEGDSRPVPASLPAGWSASHATVHLPQGATPAGLAMLLGTLALLAAAVLARFAFGGRP